MKMTIDQKLIKEYRFEDKIEELYEMLANKDNLFSDIYNYKATENINNLRNFYFLDDYMNCCMEETIKTYNKIKDFYYE